MSNKTVTHEGKVYQVDETYATSNGQIVILKDFDIELNQFVCMYDIFERLTTAFKEVLVSEYTTGTIEDAPIELDDGHCYYCEINQNTEKLEYATMFFHEGEWYWDSELSDVCRDFALRYIKPLYKMVRAS